MPSAPEHPHETRRLEALARYDVLGAPTEEAFDAIAYLMAQICETPLAAVSFVAADCNWMHAEVGIGRRDLPLETSICAHAILETGLVEIANLTCDPRTADNPLVTGWPELRFYAGAPLTDAEGLPLGALCVYDMRPRTLNEVQRTALRTLASQVMTQLDLRRALRAEAQSALRAEAQAAELARLLDVSETLKLEIDHRVKNSLQLVSSLLQMQSARSDSEAVRDALQAARGRVLAISSIHAALNRSSESSHVRLRAYAQTLVEELQITAPKGVEIALDADEIELGTSQASSLAILVNEFVTNSLKYAFPDGRAGRVHLDIRREGERVRACFSDDGVGHAVADGRPAREGLGTRIMLAVGQQLGASLDFVADEGGTTLAFDFPLRPDI